jgi:chromosome segregation ATPase
MPTPSNERRSLELELAALPKQIATYRQELADTPPLAEFKARRERLDWQIRERQKRLTEIRARLATIRAEGD